MNYPFLCPECGATVNDEAGAIRAERTCPYYGDQCFLEFKRDNEIDPTDAETFGPLTKETP